MLLCAQANNRECVVMYWCLYTCKIEGNLIFSAGREEPKNCMGYPYTDFFDEPISEIMN